MDTLGNPRPVQSQEGAVGEAWPVTGKPRGNDTDAEALHSELLGYSELRIILTLLQTQQQYPTELQARALT